MSQKMLKPSTNGVLEFPQCCRFGSLRENSDFDFRESNQKNNRIYGCVVVVLAVCVLVLCCVGIPLIVYTLSTVRTMEARLESLEEKLTVVTGKYESLLLQQHQQKQQQQHHQQQQQQQQQQKQQAQEPTHLQSVTSYEKSTTKETLNVLERSKRNPTRHTTTSYVHLIGKGGSDSITQVGDMTIFKWQKMDQHRRFQGLGLLPNHQDISSIKIETSGVYLVYSQVAVHGQPSSQTIFYYCSHKMLLKSGHGPISTILTSLLTQDNRGQEYRDMSVNYLRPLDSQLNMGVFFLLPDDELSVRIPASCGNTNYSTVPENSYFGVVKIG